MSMQQFCLRWNNHQPNFISVFTNLLTNSTLVDVTLAAEGKHLQAHKVVLSACSTYFQSLFQSSPCQHPIVILKDVKYNDLKTMVDFMYYGEVNVSQEQLPAILKTAETLKIKGLAEMPESNVAGSIHMSKSLSVSSDKAELLTPGGESSWGPDSRCSPAPLSPSIRRKRLRKSSTGSGSGSTERTSEEMPSEITLVPSPAIVKPEPISATPDGESGRSEGSLRNSTQEPSTDSEPREGSQDSTEDDPLTLQISQDSSTGEVDNPITDTGPSTSQQSTPQGLQWTLLEHGYPRFALSSCQTSLSVPNSSTFCAPEPPHNSSMRRDMSQYTGHAYQPHQMMPMSSCAVMGAYGSSQTMPNSPCPSSCPSNCPSPCSSPVYMNAAGIGQNSPTRRKRSINPQADENFLRALEAVRFGGIGFCKAARMYGVNNRTLWLEYKKRGYPVTRPSLKARIKHEMPPPSSNPMQNPPSSIAAALMGPPATSGNMLGGYMDSHQVEFAHPQVPPPPPSSAQPRQKSENETENMSESTANTHHGMNNYNQM